MSLGKVPVKAGKGAKRNASLGQGNPESGNHHRHTEKLTNLYT